MSDRDRGVATEEPSQVTITEAYRDYTSSIDVTAVIRKLLESVRPNYLRGLDCIVLTNLSGQPRKRRLGKVTSRGRRIPKARVAGFYHQEWQGKPPWIELYVDQILNRGRNLPLWIPLFRDQLFADALFHEIGHHIHFAIRPEYREKEDVADYWKRKLDGYFLRKRHWYLLPFAMVRKVFKKNQ